MKLPIALIALALSAVPALSQQQIGAYFAELGPEDARNSSGTRLTSFAAQLQQDRANYHRFGIRHADDQGDPFFGDRQTRAAIPELYRRGPGNAREFDKFAGTTGLRVLVVVCGRGSRPDYIVISHADGDGHFGC